MLWGLFSTSTTYSAGLAILAGLVAEFAATIGGGPIAPFRLAVAPLLASATLAGTIWTPDSDDADGDRITWSRTCCDIFNSLKTVITSAYSSKEVGCLCLISVAFEACLFIFVSFWTPFLQRRAGKGVELKHGVIFGVFMVFKMAGSTFANIKLTRHAGSLPGITLCATMMASALALAMPSFNSYSYSWALTAYCIFEFCIGLYWPTVAAVRSQHLPKASVHKFISVFRIPLNVAVIFSLRQMSASEDTSDSVLVAAAAVLALAAAVSIGTLGRKRRIRKSSDLPIDLVH